MGFVITIEDLLLVNRRIAFVLNEILILDVWLLVGPYIRLTNQSRGIGNFFKQYNLVSIRYLQFMPPLLLKTERLCMYGCK